ncbi:MAG: AAA family ATPase [Chitinivibrionales bacterium]|nr:AAA family ATPase [Chitinivibrionales bacterium]
MNDLLVIHNLFQFGIKRFENEDPQLKRLSAFSYTYVSTLIDLFAQLPAGIYTLTGGRQVGKSTLLKQLILHILKNKSISPANIYYMTGEVIGTNDLLLREMQEFLLKETINNNQLTYIFIDEITYIDSWHHSIKFLADAAFLDNTVVILTGSDSVFIKDTRSRLPGRRGVSPEVDFHYYPLSFKEYLLLRSNISPGSILEIENDSTDIPAENINQLYNEFESYLVTGGYCAALNSFAGNGEIGKAVYQTYFDWIRGDFIKRNKNEQSLREILTSIIKKYGSQITWNSLAADLSTSHHHTVYEYCDILQAMDTVYIQHALREDKLAAAPKKAKKIHFTDPFILNAVCKMLAITPPDKSTIVESVIISHIRRHHATYYIKSDGEIDCAWVEKGRFRPLEVKWTNKIKPEHFRLLKRYPDSALAAKVNKTFSVDGVPVYPVPVLLLRF